MEAPAAQPGAQGRRWAGSLAKGKRRNFSFNRYWTSTCTCAILYTVAYSSCEGLN